MMHAGKNARGACVVSNMSISMTGDPLRLLDDVGRECVATAVSRAKGILGLRVGNYVDGDVLELVGELIRDYILQQAERGEWRSMDIGCARDMGAVEVRADIIGGAMAVQVQLPAFIECRAPLAEELN